MAYWFTKILSTFLSITLIISPLAPYRLVQAQESGSPQTYEEARQRLDQFMELIEALRSPIDRSQFDLEALLEKLDYDADEIIRFVKEDIYFEAYSGVLRGAQGTLISGAGNALDQSLLLSTLLKDASYEARIAAGELTEQPAKTLLKQLVLPRPAIEEALDVELFEQTLREHARRIAIPVTKLDELFDQINNAPAIDSTDSYQQALASSKFILKKLTEAGVELGDPNTEAELVTEAQQYFWVEFRQGPSDPWQPVHPAVVKTTDSFHELQAHDIFTESIPDDLQHRFRFQVFLEKETNGQLTSMALAPAWERPIANLASIPVNFTILSRHLLTQINQGELEINPGSNDIFIPVLNNQPLKNGFDLSGNIIPQEAALSAFADVFATVSDKLGQATEALANLAGSSAESTKKGSTRLAALKIQYTFVKPDGTETRHLRTVFSDSSPDKNKRTEKTTGMYKALTRNFTFMVSSGKMNDAFVTDKVLNDLAQKREAIALLLRQSFNSNDDNGNQSGQQIDMSWLGHTLLYTIFDRNIAVADQNYAYRHLPSLIVHHATLPLDQKITEGIDIVQNSRRAISASDSVITHQPEALIQAGAIETRFEKTLIDSNTGHITDTHSVFEQALKQGTQIELIKPNDSQALDQLNLNPDIAAHMRRDIDSGHAIIFPKNLSSADRLAWWRIDPLTGTTLGIGENGEGGATTTEYVVIGVSMGLLALGFCMILKAGAVTNKNCISFAIPVAGGSAATLGLAVGASAAPLGLALATFALLNWMYPTI